VIGGYSRDCARVHDRGCGCDDVPHHGSVFFRVNASVSVHGYVLHGRGQHARGAQNMPFRPG
jgi:hypothetical protein